MPRLSGKQDPDKDLLKLGEAVRTRRKSLEVSQEALADTAGIDRSHMGKIERGESNFTMLNLLRISKALGCQPSDLLLAAKL